MIQLTLSDDRTAYKPGEEISGTVRWQFSTPPAALDINLGWSTHGKGSEDIGVAESQPVQNPGPQGERTFRFIAPAEPYSFSGKLISLVWSVEAIAQTGDDEAEIEIVIAPEAREIVLPRLDATPPAAPTGLQSFFRKDPSIPPR
jgi:hypothetical protein